MGRECQTHHVIAWANGCHTDVESTHLPFRGQADPTRKTSSTDSGSTKIAGVAGSRRDVMNRLGWGNDQALTALREWRSSVDWSGTDWNSSTAQSETGVAVDPRPGT